jgi:catechol 2,3-dioxygenase-like lactoylglutathione lyase family enzyme
MTPAGPKLASLDHLVLTVQDIDVTSAFYRDVLGMEILSFSPSDGSKRTALRFGKQKINLHAADQPFEPKARFPRAGSADLCFLSEHDLTAWSTHLAAHAVAIEEGPVPRTGARFSITSIYIRDPDENLIEIAVPAD